MPTSFLATEFSAIEQDGVLITALGANSTGREDLYLLLELGLTPSQQDTELGMDKPYLEYCSQKWAWYGEIEKFELWRDRVVAIMSPAAARRMQNDGVIGADFALDDRQFSELQRALQRTFSGCSFFTVHA